MLPLDRVPVAGTRLTTSARRARSATLLLDTAFTGLSYDDDGIGRATLTNPEDRPLCQLVWDATHPWVQLYTADRPDAAEPVALAVEPRRARPTRSGPGDDPHHAGTRGDPS